MLDISKIVSRAMQEEGVKAAELANRTGYSVQHIYDLLKGNRRWNETTISRVFKELDIEFPFSPSDGFDFADFMRSTRRKAGISHQRKLSEMSGVSQATISRMENGTQKPTPETLIMLAKPLKVSSNDLLQAAGYLEENQCPPSNYLESELQRLLKENARLHEENQNLKAAIKNLTKGW